MAKDQFAELLARMAATGVASADELEGCTAAEIRQLESRYGIRLPATYRHFLAVMGRRSGRLFTHDWVYAEYTDVLETTAEVREQLAEDKSRYELPSDALVILSRDFAYNFIRCNRTDDSAVWALDLGADRGRAKQTRPSVIGWIRAWADEAAEVVASGWYEVSGGDLPV